VSAGYRRCPAPLIREAHELYGWTKSAACQQHERGGEDSEKHGQLPPRPAQAERAEPNSETNEHEQGAKPTPLNPPQPVRALPAAKHCG
jgi:hypothetical protein